jgi:hypothetical protein
MRIPFIAAAMVAGALFVLPAITRPARVGETLHTPRPEQTMTAACPHGGWHYQATDRRLYDRLGRTGDAVSLRGVVCTT